MDVLRLERELERLRKEPDNPGLYRDIGILFAETGYNRSAETYLRKAFECGPNDESTLYHYAQVLYARSKWRESEAVWKSYLGIKPEDPFALERIGDCCYLTGRYEQAAEYRKRSREAGKAGLNNGPQS